MSSEVIPAHPPDQRWLVFAQSQSGHHFLTVDPLYALSEKYVDAIDAAVPDLLDLPFERDLNGAAQGGGFFRHRSFRCLHEHDLFPDALRIQADRAVKEMLTEGLDMNQPQVETFFEAKDEQRRLDDSRRRAYAAWLIMNEQFRSERDDLRQEFQGEVDRLGRFPSTAPPFVGDPRYAAFLVFLRRWCLETFLTWDLPVPFRRECSGGADGTVPVLPAAGITVFLPWYRFRDKELDLHDLAAELKSLVQPGHLKEWLSPPSGEKNLGYTRLAGILTLYRYWYLALTQRYGSQLSGRAEKLGHAFASVMNLSDDSVKKYRLELWNAVR